MDTNGLMNYLQGGGNKETPIPSPQSTSNTGTYNPFEAGIQRAISSARTSLGMTSDQENRALRKGMLAFGNKLGEMPRERGLYDNFLSAGVALNPAIQAYDDSAAASEGENQELANQILKLQAEKEKAERDYEHELWARGHAENQLGEQRRGTNLLDAFRKDSLAEDKRSHDLLNNFHLGSIEMQKTKAASGGKGGKHGEKISPESMDQTFDYMQQKIDSLGEKGQRNLLSRFAGNNMPGGFIPSEEQAEIEALGSVLEGMLFNAWGYRSQAEFEHLPKISINNPPEVNKAILQQLRNITNIKMGSSPSQLINNDQNRKELDGLMPVSFNQTEGVLMRNAQGEQFRIPEHEIEDAIQDGLMIVE